MHRLGRIITWSGVILSALGTIAGLALMSQQPQMAKFFLMLVPIGFVLLLTGVVTAVMTDSTDNSPVNPD